MNGPLVDLNGRVRDRAREARQRRAVLLLRSVGVLAVLAVLAWVVTGTPLVSVQRVAVSGNRTVSTQTIMSAAAVQLGVPLAQVDTRAISQRLSSVPGLARGDVSVTLPDTVSIRVIERTLVYVVASGAGYAWVDPSGVRFNETKERPAGYPLAVISGDDQQLLADVATVVSALPPSLTARVQQVRAATRDSILIDTTDKTQIVWGGAGSSSLKGQVADALAKARPSCHVIDVSAPAHPTSSC